MREQIVIPLKKPLKGPNNESVKQIVLREPTFDEYLTYGDPFTVAQSKDGMPFAVENEDVIREYIRICLVEPKDPQLLSQGNALLGRDVKHKLLSFFRPDAADGEDLENSQTNSPSVASGETASSTSKS